MKYDFSTADIFGIEVGLKYLNKERFQSNFGAFISTVIACLICFQASIIGKELYLKDSPQVIVSEKYVASPKRFTMKKETFNFAFGIQFPKNSSHFIDNQIYTVEVVQQTMNKQYDEEKGQYVQKWKYTPIEASPCQPNDFQVEETISYFANLSGISQMYCINQDKYEPFIEGNFDQDTYSLIRIIFRLCSGNQNCKSSQELKEFLTNSHVAIYTNDFIVDPTNYQPFQAIGKNFYWYVSPAMTKNVLMYLRNIFIESDEGLFFEDKKHFNKTSQSYQTESIVFDEENYFFQLDMRFEKGKESYIYRSYEKIYSILVRIGGMAKSLMIIGAILCIPVNKLQFFRLISNQLFVLTEKSPNKQEKNNQNNQQSNEKINHLLSYDGDSNKNQATIRKPTSPLIQNQIENIAPKMISHISSIKIDSENHLVSVNQDRNQRKNSTSIYLSPQIKCMNNSFDKSIKPQKYQHDKEIYSQTEAQIEDGENLKKLKQLQNSILKINQSNSQSKKIVSEIGIKVTNTRIKGFSKLGANSIFQMTKNLKEKPPKKYISLKWYDYLKFYLWPFGMFQKRKKQLLYSVEKIYQHLDIINIVQKLLEIEKIKQLLLNEDQINLIQFFPKPTLDINEIEKESSLKKENNNQKRISLLLHKESQLSEQEKVKQAYQSFKNILKKEQLSDLDKKIIEMIDKSLFDNMESHLEYLQDLEENDEIRESNFIESMKIKNSREYNNHLKKISIDNFNKEINVFSPSNLSNLIKDDLIHQDKDSKFFEFHFSPNSSDLSESIKINGEDQRNSLDHEGSPQLQEENIIFPNVPLFHAKKKP